MNKSAAGKMWDFVTSRNVAIVLLIVITAMLAAGAFLPNSAFLSPEEDMEMQISHPVLKWLGDRFNSQTMARAPLFGVIGIFLIVSTSLCSIDRLLKKKNLRPDAILSFPSSTSQRPIVTGPVNRDAGSVEEDALEWFNRKRWRILTENTEQGRVIAAAGGNAGFWGSIFFHFLLITALMGLVFYYFGAYRATLAFTEGQSYRLAKERLIHIVREPLWGLSLPDAEVGLVRQYSIYPESDPWNAIEHVAVFRVSSGKGAEWEKEVRINDPLEIEGKQFLLQRGGFSPRIVIKDGQDNKIFSHFVALKGEGGTRDSFDAAGTGLTLNISFFPDMVMKGGRPETRSFQVRNPFILLSAYRGDSKVHEELFPFGGSTRFGGYEVSVPEVRRWVEMELVGEPGIGFFFVMSFIGLGGVALRMFDPDERIYIILKGSKSGVIIESYTYSRHFAGMINEKRNELLKRLTARGISESEDNG